jgi:phosphate acetyltransferase
MEILKEIRDRARNARSKITLPEGWDERIIKSAKLIHQEGIASEIIIPFNKDKTLSLADELNIDIEKIATVYAPEEHPEFKTFVEEYYRLRKHKGITKKDAENVMMNPIYFASMLVRQGEADGAVMGADTPTSETIRSALHSIGLSEGNRTLSSFFLMIVPDKSFGVDGILLFADCAVVPYPSPEQLADIAIETSKNAKKLLNITPKVAMLSFSTKGSATHPHADKVIKATEIAKKRAPDLIMDGEMQADTALVQGVAKKKAPDSVIKGDANCLIFPNLDSGNISYKLTQRLAGAKAIGPIFQGLKKPVNDLSRGCSADDVVNVVAFTMAQSAL